MMAKSEETEKSKVKPAEDNVVQRLLDGALQPEDMSKLGEDMGKLLGLNSASKAAKKILDTEEEDSIVKQIFNFQSKIAAESQKIINIPQSMVVVQERKALALLFASGDSFFKPLADPSLLADDFIFRGPTIGPLNKADFIGTGAYFAVYDAFPDIQVKVAEFAQDPEDPNRFWTVVRVSGTHTAPLNFGTTIKPTGKKLDIGPQVLSVTFNDQDKISLVTAGYVTDAHEGRIAGPFGAAFGVAKSIGVPVPRIGGLRCRMACWRGAQKKGFPKAVSHRDDLPAAWQAQGRAHGLRSKDAW